MWQGNFDRLFIGGEWVAPASTDVLTVVSPVTEQPVASVPAGSPADIDAAAAAARRAFDHGPWPQMSLAERIDIMTELNRLFAEHETDIAELCTAEVGYPISQAIPIQARRSRAILEAAIDQARAYPFESLRQASTGRALVVHQPVGVVAAIVPFNAPHLGAMMKLAYGLLAGCTFVLKPAQEAPLSAYLIASLTERAGLPPGVLNVVAADRAVSEYLVRHEDVDKVSFTGSVAAGRKIGAICGDLIRRVTLELGGKSAAIVLDDADLDVVVNSLRNGSFLFTGQVCSAKTRVVVSRRIADELQQRLVAMVQALPIGDPQDPATHFGPLVTDAHRKRVESYIDVGRDEGAKIVCGGGRPREIERGWYVEPTIFGDVHPSMRIAQEEIFGPVLSIMTYDDEEQAVAMANDSQYGLSGQVYTNDASRGLAVAKRVRTGAIEVNANPIGLSAPQGGFKHSGIGRELGPEGFDAFIEIQSIGLPPELAPTES